MSMVCKYYHQCLDGAKAEGLCIVNEICRTCANNPYSKASHYYEKIPKKKLARAEDPAKYREKVDLGVNVGDIKVILAMPVRQYPQIGTEEVPRLGEGKDATE